MSLSSLTRFAALGLMLSAGMAVAEGDRSVAQAQARVDSMQAVAQNSKVLGNMANDKAPFDAAAAAAAKEGLIAAAAGIAAAYEVKGEADPASEALPEVWTDWAGFTAKVKVLEEAALALDPTSLEGVKAGMEAVGPTCRDCHNAYRM